MSDERPVPALAHILGDALHTLENEVAAGTAFDEPEWVQGTIGLLRSAFAEAASEAAADSLPNYHTDPAAWGALMERERIALVPWGEHFAAFDPDYWESNGEGVRAVGVALKGWHSGPPGPAICAAVLAKHGREVKP